MGGGAWPFLVGGVICLVNSDNERDLNLLTSGYHVWFQSKAAGLWERVPFGVPVFCRSVVLVPKDLVSPLSLLRGTIDV